jgi:hypothetical protein
MCMHPDGPFNCIVNLIQIMGPKIPEILVQSFSVNWAEIWYT